MNNIICGWLKIQLIKTLTGDTGNLRVSMYRDKKRYVVVTTNNGYNVHRSRHNKKSVADKEYKRIYDEF